MVFILTKSIDEYDQKVNIINESKQLFAWYSGELQPDRPTYLQDCKIFFM